ncbi:NUDIX hydrolase [Beijerinckia indica]|uniref:NUDIX hydrolase n=1 Tax=Beijerinckia indica subsp. indica (strain ATCC 9039 / DSM 1715 / NCIMB 8712) TaxID=395963 RepID=B2IGD6_BEII9|nr:NUDIX hydrolase [Beijerinckia indica]ACB94321.1 NUDIX hydrolase [Beijerinckia indica subsp. indica ATCC 9039]
MPPSPARIETVDDIFYEHVEKPWDFALDQAAEIDRHWTKLTDKNPHLFNGRVLLMHDYALTTRENRRWLTGQGFEADYKAFMAWRDFGFPGTAVYNCFAMAALVSADGAFMLGQMNLHTANPGRVYFPAGTPDPEDLRGTIIDLEGSVLRELEEETGLGPADVTIEPGWTLVFDLPRLACMKRVRSPLSAQALQEHFARFIAPQDLPELSALVPVSSTRDLDEAHMPGFILTYLQDQLNQA